MNKRVLKLLVQGLLDQSKRIKSGVKPIIPFDAPHRQKHSTSFINGSKSLKEKHVAWMCNFLDVSLKEGKTPCIPELLQRMRAQFIVNIKSWTLRRLLAEKGYSYGKLHVVCKIDDDDPDATKPIHESLQLL